MKNLYSLTRAIESLFFEKKSLVRCRSLLAGLLLLTIGLLLPNEVAASHFRYGQITWTPDPNVPGKIDFTVNSAWRRSFFCGGPSCVGGTFTPYIFELGDGSSVNGTSVVVSENLSDDWVFMTQTVSHTYTTSGNFTAFFQSCCRLGGLENVSNVADYRSETIVNIDLADWPNNNNPPNSNLPVIVSIQQGNTPALFNIPAFDIDGDPLTFRLATFAETRANNPAGLSVDANTGNATFIPPSGGFQNGDGFAAAIVIEDGQSKTVVDFLIQVVGNSLPPVFAYGPTPNNNSIISASPGTNVSFTVEVNDPDAGSSISLSATGLPIGAVFTPNLPTPLAAGPVTTSFQWVPTAADLGSYLITIIAEDEVGVQALTTVIINVGSGPQFTSGSGGTGGGGSGGGAGNGFSILCTGMGPFSVSYTAADADVNDLVTISSVLVDPVLPPSSPTPPFTPGGGFPGMSTLPSSLSFVPSLPAGPSNPVSVTLTGTILPTDWGIYNIKLIAEDESGATDTANTFLVIDQNPVFTSPEPTEPVLALIGEPFSMTITGADPDSLAGDRVAFADPSKPYTTYPSWLTVTDDGNGTLTLTGTPTVNERGINPVRVELHDRTTHFQHTHCSWEFQNFAIDVVPCLPATDSLYVDQNCGVTVPDYAASVTSVPSATLTQNPAAGTMLSLGIEVVDIIVNYGPDSDTCEVTVSVLDTIRPVFTCNTDTVYLNDNGEWVYFQEGTSVPTDNCGDFTEPALISEIYECEDVNQTFSYSRTVTDDSGNSSTCNTTVFVRDTIKPVLVCATDTVYLDANGDGDYVAATGLVSATDNCTVLPQANTTVAAYSCSDVGNIFNFIQGATDQSGNLAECISTVLVLDSIPPVVTCSTDTVYLDAAGTASYDVADGLESASDACSITDQSPSNVLSLTCANLTSATPYLQFATDPSGNTGTCTSTILVLDTIAPTITCKADTAYLLADGTVAYNTDSGVLTSDDNCDNTNLLSSAINTYDCSNIGAPLTISQVLSDGSGNLATCTSTVQVLDTIVPTAVCVDTTVYLLATGMVDIDISVLQSDLEDNCGTPQGNPPTIATFSCSQVGTTNPYLLTVTDGSGNTGTCVVDITVLDTIATAMLDCSEVVGEVFLNQDCATTTVPDYRDSVIVMNADSVVQFPAGGSTIGSQDSVVMLVGYRSCANDTCRIILSFTDTFPPTITCPADVEVFVPVSGCEYEVVDTSLDAVATDNCAADVPVVSNGFDGAPSLVGMTFTPGLVAISFTATDASGNVSDCTYNLTVTDTVPPVFDVPDTVIYLDESGEAELRLDPGALATDNCEPFSVGLRLNPDDADTDVLNFTCTDATSTLTVFAAATDTSGNVAIDEIVLTILDTISPVTTCKDSIVYLGADGTVTFDVESLQTGAADNCGIQSLSPPGQDVLDCSNLGAPVTYTQLATDLSGNTGNCSSSLTVLDSIPPVITCRDTSLTLLISEPIVSLNAEVLGTVTDNCSATVLPVAVTYGCDELLLENTVQLFAEDQSGLLDSCTLTVTLLDPESLCNQAPVAVCQPVTVSADQNCMGIAADTLFNGGSTDPDGDELTYRVVPPGPYPLGETTVELIVSDAQFSDTCETTITVIDDTPPAISFNDTTLYLDENGMASLSIDDYEYATIDVDNCDDDVTITDLFRLEDEGENAGAENGSSEAKSRDAVLNFDCADIDATVMVAIVGQDASGNEARDTISVTVLDTLGPVILQTNFINLRVTTSMISGACPGNTVFADSLLNQPILVSDVRALCDTILPDGFTFGFFTMLFDDNCTDDDDISVLITSVESTILANGSDSIVLNGFLVDEYGNQSVLDTATIVLVDDIDPEATTTDQTIVLNDGNTSQTLTPDDLVTATDNCGEAPTIVFDRPLTFTGADIGTNVLTATITDASGNVITVMVTVIVTFDQPDLACIGEINLTLNDDCQGLLVPEMLLTGNTGLLDAFDLAITVMDDDPSNGPIVDGCGSFQYMISDASGDSVAPVEGFTGAFAEENWTVASTGAEAAATFTATSLELTSGVAGDGDFSNSDDITVSYQFAEAGTVSFDADYFVETEIIEDIIIVDFDGNIIFQSISDEGTTGPTESGNFSVLEEVPAGATLMVMIEGDDFTTSGNISRITLTNFLFQPAVSVLALDFETCWGIVNAEDKTPPALVSTPADVSLLCVDLDGNNLSTLPNTTSKCYRVSSETGATIPGTMTPALRDRLLAGGLSPLVPTFTDGCTNEIEVCVSDAVAFGTDPSCDDVVITRTFVATEVAVCASAAGEANESTVASYTLTFERPSLGDLFDENIEAVVEVERCGTANPTRADYPAPRPSDFPFLAVGDRTFPLSSGEAVCNIGVTYADGPAIVTCPFTYKFIRTYTVIDWCDPSDIRTFTQVVKVGDTTAPVFTGPSAPTNVNGDLVYGTNAGNICAAYLRLDDVSAVDNCSGTNVSIAAAIYPGGDLSGTPIGSFDVVPGGTPELSSAIPAGRHLLRYTYEDECGNAGFEDFFFVVEDQTPPVAICEDGLNISIAGGTNDGFAVLTPDNIDAGSYDDCSGITRSIARVNANNLAIGGYRDQITLTCADIGTVRVGLRVTDALGNENFCWLDVLVEDKLAPTCVAPGDVVITCDEYNTTLPADIMDATDATLDALFGTAAGVDNCGTTITQRISGDVNSCGVGSFVRTFTSTDDAGFTNANNCTQNIRVDGVHDYRLTFPVDVSSDCAVVPEYDGVGAEELACDLITTTSDVDTLRTIDAGDECFKLRITYDVINWCEYNSFGEPYLVPRDGNGVNNRQRRPRDLEADPLYVNVLPGATLTTTDDDRAFMTLFTDRVFSPNAPQRDQPIDDNLLSDGDDNDYGDNDVDSRGFFRYVQFVKIYDEVAPEITFTEPTECFSGNNEDCSATVELTFTALDACSDAVVGVELDADYDATTGFVRTADITGNTTGDEDGNFTVSLTNVPVGEHAIRVRASDGCGNFDVQIIEFCVTADKSPTPICIQTLTVTLMDDGNGGGIAAIWASDFIASPIVDCFGNPVTKYSLYRTSDAGANGFVPAVGQVGIDDINCADRGDLSVRVYAFDDNGSTPDYCEVVVEVQDNAPWCGGSTGDLSGLVLTPADEAMEGVQMTLTGGMDATMLTDANGAFEFRNVQYNQDYTVQPSYEAAFSNRDVKTSDLVAAIADILGTQPFDNGYDYIAADVNRDGEHDVRDVVMSSRAILGITNGYDLGNWTFVTAETEFNLSNPYGAEFPEVYNVNDLQGSFRAADFVGIMMGDLVDNNGRSAQTLRTEDVRLEAGQTHTVVLDGAHLAGFQATIELAAGLELVAADYAGEGGLNLNRAAEGLIAVALRNEASLTLEVRATEAGLLSELITLSDAITVREGVAANGVSNALELTFTAPATAPKNALYQNTPNPVVDVTSIRFELAEAGTATLTVRDVAGRLILTREVDAVAGLNRVELEKLAAGVLTYTLTSGDFTASRKMVVVK